MYWKSSSSTDVDSNISSSSDTNLRLAPGFVDNFKSRCVMVGSGSNACSVLLVAIGLGFLFLLVSSVGGSKVSISSGPGSIIWKSVKPPGSFGSIK